MVVLFHIVHYLISCSVVTFKLLKVAVFLPRIHDSYWYPNSNHLVWMMMMMMSKTVIHIGLFVLNFYVG